MAWSLPWHVHAFAANLGSGPASSIHRFCAAAAGRFSDIAREAPQRVSRGNDGRTSPLPLWSPRTSPPHGAGSDRAAPSRGRSSDLRRHAHAADAAVGAIMPRFVALLCLCVLCAGTADAKGGSPGLHELHPPLWKSPRSHRRHQLRVETGHSRALGYSPAPAPPKPP
jgi:hypothetical protein